MGLFDRFKKSEKMDIQVEPGALYAPVGGRYIPLKEIPDPVFSAGTLGDGCGIEPDEEKVYAPIDCKVSMIAETRHAIGLLGKNGEEFLIHVGMDTVDMNGKGFSLKTEQGSQVKAGQLLLEFDREEIKRAGHPVTTAFVLTNSSDYPEFHIDTGKEYHAGEKMGHI